MTITNSVGKPVKIELVEDFLDQVDLIAEGLEAIAKRLRDNAHRRLHNSHNATGVSGVLIDEYTQAIGQNGRHLSGLVNAAQRLDNARQVS